MKIDFSKIIGTIAILSIVFLLFFIVFIKYKEMEKGLSYCKEHGYTAIDPDGYRFECVKEEPHYDGVGYITVRSGYINYEDIK